VLPPAEIIAYGRSTTRAAPCASARQLLMAAAWNSPVP